MLIFIITVLVVIVVFGATLYFKSSKYKGKKGEKKVARALVKNISEEKFVINDLILKTESGSTSQIDHVVINHAGIWVIETKNYAGRIYGNALQLNWTQVLANGKIKNQFYNPVKQNASHAYHISKLINGKPPIYRYVVFTGNADLSGVKAGNVCNLQNFLRIINRSNQSILTTEDMRLYYNSLLNLKNDNKVTKKEHIRNIKKMKKNIKSGICPRCGGKLVLRNGRNGQFYGCSNYPNCKFTKSLY